MARREAFSSTVTSKPNLVRASPTARASFTALRKGGKISYASLPTTRARRRLWSAGTGETCFDGATSRRLFCWLWLRGRSGACWPGIGRGRRRGLFQLRRLGHHRLPGGIDVVAPCDGDAVVGRFKLGLQRGEASIGGQIGIVLGGGKQFLLRV